MYGAGNIIMMWSLGLLIVALMGFVFGRKGSRPSSILLLGFACLLPPIGLGLNYDKLVSVGGLQVLLIAISGGVFFAGSGFAFGRWTKR
jgi:hypothetical protein